MLPKKLFTSKSYISKRDLALKNPQRLICHKIQWNTNFLGQLVGWFYSMWTPVGLIKKSIFVLWIIIWFQVLSEYSKQVQKE